MDIDHTAPDQDDDKTVVIKPSVEPAEDSRNISKALQSPSSIKAINDSALLEDINTSPILKISIPLINVLIELKRKHDECDFNKLRSSILSELKKFSSLGAQQNIPSMKLILSRYVLAAAVDEFVMNAPWARQSKWDEDPITSILFDDAAGGDKFFSILDKVVQDPVNNNDLIYLMYIILSIGFEGKYHVMEHGQERLGMLKESIYKILIKQRENAPQDISSHHAVTQKNKRDTLPTIRWWQVAACVIGALGAIYLFFYASNYTFAREVAYNIKHVQTAGGLTRAID